MAQSVGASVLGSCSVEHRRFELRHVPLLFHTSRTVSVCCIFLLHTGLRRIEMGEGESRLVYSCTKVF